jgi:hypothetical protein
METECFLLLWAVFLSWWVQASEISSFNSIQMLHLPPLHNLIRFVFFYLIMGTKLYSRLKICKKIKLTAFRAMTPCILVQMYPKNRSSLFFWNIYNQNYLPHYAASPTRVDVAVNDQVHSREMLGSVTIRDTYLPLLKLFMIFLGISKQMSE